MRLQKYLARCGVASRRHGEELISAGRVAVNGAVITRMGVKVVVGIDEVCVDGRVVNLPESTTTLMLYKPAGYVTTMDDPQGRPTVAELVDKEKYPGLFPIGRLDAETTGLLLFTTDGILGQQLMHPRHHVKKTYYALVQGKPTQSDLSCLRKGIMLDDGLTLPAEISIVEGTEMRFVQTIFHERYDQGSSLKERPRFTSSAFDDRNTSLKIGIREGRNRQIRRMFSAIGHPVLALHRQSIGSLSLGNLMLGHTRVLDSNEVQALQNGVCEPSRAHE